MSNFEHKARRYTLWVIGVMVAIWIVLGFFSFSKQRNRPQTTKISFEHQTALRGKQVFQAYNCMDCHTIVGNGAYFAPDLTKIYAETGPAWLKAYLGSPGTYPAKAAVNVQFQQLKEKPGTATFEEYLSKYEGAGERITDRGGVEALMPNLRFSQDEINALIAYLKYTSEINTAGWPPRVIARKTVIEAEKRKLEQRSGLSVGGTALTTEPPENAPAEAAASPAEHGGKVALQLGCVACHSTDGSVKVGPSWKGLYGSAVLLSDAKQIVADTAYLRQSILEPDAMVVKGFHAGVMPPYQGLVTDQELSDLIEYIKSVK